MIFRRVTPGQQVGRRGPALKIWPLFEGYRGSPPLDAAALQALILRVSAMVEDIPHIAGLDLNPVLVYGSGKGCSVVDARVRLTRPLTGTPRGARTQTTEA